MPKRELRLLNQVLRTWLFATAAFLTGMIACRADDPKFIFVKSTTTKKHIAVQPRDDYHRVYYALRVENCAGKTAFAQVRCRPSKGETETLQSVTLDIKANNELWRVYIRAPKHANVSATYQVVTVHRAPGKLGNLGRFTDRRKLRLSNDFRLCG